MIVIDDKKVSPAIEAGARMRNAELDDVTHLDIDTLLQAKKAMLIVEFLDLRKTIQRGIAQTITPGFQRQRKSLIERDITHSDAANCQIAFRA